MSKTQDTSTDRPKQRMGVSMVVPLETAVRTLSWLSDNDKDRFNSPSEVLEASGKFEIPFAHSKTDVDSTIFKSFEEYGLANSSSKPILTDRGHAIISPVTPEERSTALREAVLEAPFSREALKELAGKPIPEIEFLANRLKRQFELTNAQSRYLGSIVLQNLQYVGLAASTSRRDGVIVPGTISNNPGQEASQDHSARTYLETCFVLMPFGGWGDRYFRDIFDPAIRAASFEPVRGDDLFATGSVIEQIAEQIDRASVLVAELTGRNPNVFYELGIAHARAKPVILISASIDDVPFDLRHLRVIVYDIRDPKWADTLASQMTAFLQHAKAEPRKSIPNPFRDAGTTSVSLAPEVESPKPTRKARQT